MKKIIPILILLLLPIIIFAAESEVKAIKYYPSVMKIKMLGRLTQSQRTQTGVGFAYYLNDDKDNLYFTSDSTKKQGSYYGKIKTITPDNDRICVMAYAYNNDTTKTYSDPVCTSLPRCFNGVTLHPQGDNRYTGIVSLQNKVWYTGDYNSVMNQIGNQTANYCGTICYKGAEIHFDKLYKTYYGKDLNDHSFFKKSLESAKETIDRNYYAYGLDSNPQCDVNEANKPEIELIETKTTVYFGAPDDIEGIIKFKVTAPEASGVYLKKEYIYPVLTPQYAGVEKEKTFEMVNASDKGSFLYISAGETAEITTRKVMTAKEIRSVHYYMPDSGDNCFGYSFNMTDKRICFDDLSRFTTEEQNINPGTIESPEINLLSANVSKVSGVFGKLIGDIRFTITAPSYKPIYILEDDLKAQVSDSSLNILIQTVDNYTNSSREGEYIKIEQGKTAELRSYVEAQATQPASVYTYLKTTIPYTDMDNSSRLVGIDFKTTSVYIGVE